MDKSIINENAYSDKDIALQPVEINTKPDSKYDKSIRRFHGIPSIERTANGRLWVSFVGGGTDEGPDNHVLLIWSDDDGNSWTDVKFVIDGPGLVRCYDANLWIDPSGRLWLFWKQCYNNFDGRCGVWASVCSNSDSENPEFSYPRRISNGVMLNKPTVLSTGEWLLSCAVWNHVESVYNNLPDERYSNVVSTTDNGISFHLKGHADVPERTHDEHMIIEKNDKSLWMLVRTRYGIGQSYSFDQGRTWTPGENSGIEGPDSRFFIRRLNSGNLLLVNHFKFTGRNNMTAMLSDDDGKTWKGFLLLDEREQVSYPDGCQTPDGRIYIVYDRERTGAKEILMAVINEEDILAGKCISEGSRLKQIVAKAEGEPISISKLLEMRADNEQYQGFIVP